MKSWKIGIEHRVILQERDRRLLCELGPLHVTDRAQAGLITSCRSVTRTNHLLLRLFKAGLLERRFIGSIGAGRKAVYALSRRGAQLAGVPYRGFSRRQGGLASELFLLHQLEVNHVLLLVKYQLAPMTGARLGRLMQFAGQPLSAPIPLVPDGYFELQLNEKTLPMFLEVDLGTEALKVWHQKTQRYLQLATSGEFTRQFGQEKFRVLVVTPSDARLAAIRRTVASVTAKVFWFAALPTINRDGLWSTIWLRSQAEHRQSLL